MILGSLAVSTSEVSAAPRASTKVFTVTASIKASSGRTVILVARSGRVLASKKLSTASGRVSLRTPRIKSLSGASLHLVGATGDYYGPIVLNWAGTKSARASRVATTFGTTSTTVALGTVKVTARTANQGAGVVSKKFPKSGRVTVRASAGIPTGVGTYGKSPVSALGVEALAATYTAGNVAPGADADLDGIVNAFDVNDDNDTKLDFQDDDVKPQPVSSGDDCAAAKTFSIFSNFKATSPNLSGTINAYGAGSNKATNPAIAGALTSTLTFAIQRVTGTVCGGTVTKNEFRGVDVPYAPAGFVTLPSGGFDVQWSVGAGQMNNAAVPGLSPHTFDCSAGCPISGQDTFIQKVTTTNGVYEFIANPTFVFVTHPMIKSLNGVAVDYSSPNPLGSQNNELEINRSLDTTISIELYRPQRIAIEGESAMFYDIGGLGYFPDAPNAIDPTPDDPPTGPNQGPGRCDPAKQSDSTMTTDAPINEASPAVLTITWEIAKIEQCFDAKSIAWQDGELLIDLQVIAPVQNSGNAAQKIYIQLLTF
jgi:hypothetical protein